MPHLSTSRVFLADQLVRRAHERAQVGEGDGDRCALPVHTGGEVKGVQVEDPVRVHLLVRPGFVVPGRGDDASVRGMREDAGLVAERQRYL